MFAKLSLLISLAATALAQTYTINTPASLVQCQPASITWSGGTGPYILAVIPGGQVGATAIETLSSSLTSSPFTWTVNIASGTYITLKLTDSTGAIAYSSPLTIQAGSSNACLNSSASTSGVATTGQVTTTGSGSATLSGTTSAAATTSHTSVVLSASSVFVASSAASSAATSSSSHATSSNSTPVNSAAATSTTSHSGALATAVANIPAIAAGVLGVAALL